MKIAVFYHCLFGIDGRPLEHAFDVVRGQMEVAEDVNLFGNADEIHIGVNGGDESVTPAMMILPEGAKLTFHGTQCRTELRTIRMLEEWLPDHPDWHVLYFHSKGATHPPDHGISAHWRACMMRYNVQRWRRCVFDLEHGFDAVGCHWMEPPATPKGQYIFAGTFFWANSNFLRTLPSVLERPQIKQTGLDSLDSRYEAEVWLGNGPVKPKIKDYHGPDWNPGKWQSCEL